MRNWRVLASLLLVLAMILAACGGEGTSDDPAEAAADAGAEADNPAGDEDGDAADDSDDADNAEGAEDAEEAEDADGDDATDDPDDTDAAEADDGDDGDDADEGDDDGDEDAVGDSAESADLLGAGATFITPVMLEWIRDNEPGIGVNYQSIGSGGGIEQFLQESVHFGSTERYLSDEEIAEAQEIRGCEPLHIPDAFGGVVLGFNDPDLEAALEEAGQDSLVLDGETLSDIFLTEITSWDDPAIAELNPDVELPSTPLVAVHRADSSGTSYIFTRYLANESEAWDSEVGYGSEVTWPQGTIGAPGNEGVSAEVLAQPGAVGYLAIAYALENDIPMVSMVNADGEAVYPSVDTVTEGPATIVDTIPDDFRYDILDVGGTGWPIVGTHWILAWECGYEEGEAEALQDFLTRVVTEGDDLAEDLLYSPVTGDFEDRVLEQVERIGSVD